LTHRGRKVFVSVRGWLDAREKKTEVYFNKFCDHREASFSILPNSHSSREIF
jgi:hypothetical protein